MEWGGCELCPKGECDFNWLKRLAWMKVELKRPVRGYEWRRQDSEYVHLVGTWNTDVTRELVWESSVAVGATSF